MNLAGSTLRVFKFTSLSLVDSRVSCMMERLIESMLYSDETIIS